MSFSKKDLRTFLTFLNENGTYQLQKKDESLYRKVIEFFTTKSKSKTDLNIQRIDNLKKKGNSYLADCLYGNKIKKMKLELGDKRLLSLLKDYEFKIKGDLKVINEMYLKLKEKGLTEEDYKEIKEKEIREMYKYIQNGEGGEDEDEGVVREDEGVVVREDEVVQEDDMGVEPIEDTVDDSIQVDESIQVDQDSIQLDDSIQVDQESIQVDESIQVKQEINQVNHNILESLTPSQPPTPNKKINFTNLLIYSRFK